MYKIVFVVAVFAFALQGAFSSPVADTEAKQPNANPGVVNVVNPSVNSKANDGAADTTAATTTEAAATTTAAPKSGASSTEMCLLLVQVSSLALVAKHMLL
ncbi:uncharacterized protein LOC132943464 [Metopolophium dirhodum]|uniref:uncharacterized protein LOC132943464 n=1 Tax=Metopolophium dirhodum TaxID=44670 RepID=UPI002990652F|nr:uncharacterized protein LOC132943464 [Metopolophium dirhodum]